MKYSVNFSPERCRNNEAEGNVRMIVQWSGGGRVSMFVGHRVTLSKWSKDAQRCKPNTTHGKYPAVRINRDIQHYEDVVSKVMLQFDEPPQNNDVKRAIQSELGVRKEDGKRVLERDYREFYTEQSALKGWSEGTTYNAYVFANILRDMKINYADVVTPAKQDKLILTMQRNGLRSGTIREYIRRINWFLRWAEKKGYIQKAPNYTPTIRTIPKQVIYLNKQELLTLYRYPLESIEQRRVRDIFCLCAFTGLRYSDASRLKQHNIIDGAIKLTTKKDRDNLKIELNKYAESILKRVELTDEEKEMGYIMPTININRANPVLKEAAKTCGLDSPTSIQYYKGGQRVEQTLPKHELISTHTGRKTFICTALSMNISPNIVMKWTGHSSYKAMQPYIDIMDEAKREAMTAFDNLEDKNKSEQ